MDFTDLLNQGHKRYIEKHVKPRKFGRCDGCSEPHLLINYMEPDEKDFSWWLCNKCYDKITFRR